MTDESARARGPQTGALVESPDGRGPGARAVEHRDRSMLPRWRVILGRSAEKQGLQGSLPSGSALARADAALEYLFGERSAGTGESDGLTVTGWIDEVTELFPRSTKEVMERELVRRRGLGELLSSPELLERIEPSTEIVKTLLTHRDLLKPETRALARKIIDRVVEELRQKLKLAVLPAITGAIRRDRHSPRRVLRNLDLRTTVRRNLHNWSEERKRLVVDRIFFHAAEQRSRPWHVIVVVDQSGSMLDSAIYSAVMASIFAELPAMRTSLLLFDTRVVDISERVGQPVDVLMQIQLGGGTLIGNALVHAATLVREPARTIMVLVTDFMEGGEPSLLFRTVGALSDAGVRMVGLGALGYDAKPSYDRAVAGKCRKAGMDILACTPERLAEAMAEIIQGK